MKRPLFPPRGYDPSDPYRIVRDVVAVHEAFLRTVAPEQERLWLRTPSPVWGGWSAIEVIADDETRRVLDVLDALASGAFV